MQNWQTVFDSYPEATQIYVVNGMPFLAEHEALGHAKTTGKPVEKVQRSAAKAGKVKSLAEDQAEETASEPTETETAQPPAPKKGKSKKG